MGVQSQPSPGEAPGADGDPKPRLLFPDSESEDREQVTGVPFPEAEINDPGEPFFIPAESGDSIVEGEIVGEEKPKREQAPPREPKSAPPALAEWMDFFSRIVIRSITDWYINLAFRGIDENELTEREVNAIRIAPEERDRIARPFAEFSIKSKFMRKHGRMIVASADSIDAIILLGMWFARVNRIAARHRPAKVRVNGSPGPDTQNGTRGARGGTVPPENIRIYNPGGT